MRIDWLGQLNVVSYRMRSDWLGQPNVVGNRMWIVHVQQDEDAAASIKLTSVCGTVEGTGLVGHK